MTEEKRLEDMTAEELAELKIEFAPGAFDDFEGTQEELDELVAEIHRMFTSGEIFQSSEVIHIDELIDDSPELAVKLLNNLENLNHRNLQ
jgi:uncharacterized protein YqgV (UPF0045/DUF77 family)